MTPFKPSAIYVDEFHRQYTDNRGLPGRLGSMSDINWIPRIWAISGTPFADGPAGMRGYLSVMQTTAWASHPDFRYLVTAEIDQMQREIDTAIRSGNSAEIMEGWKEIKSRWVHPVS